MQRTLTAGGSITDWLVSSFICLDSAASQLTKNSIFSSLVKSNLVKLETSCTVILPPMVTVHWLDNCWHEASKTYLAKIINISSLPESIASIDELSSRLNFV